jgi:hypothetical protein
LSGTRVHRDEAERDRDAEPRGVDQAGHLRADERSKSVIRDRGSKDSGDDRPRLAQPRGQYDGQEHGLVADLRKCDDGDGREEGFDHWRAR